MLVFRLPVALSSLHYLDSKRIDILNAMRMDFEMFYFILEVGLRRVFCDCPYCSFLARLKAGNDMGIGLKGLLSVLNQRCNR